MKPGWEQRVRGSDLKPSAFCSTLTQHHHWRVAIFVLNQSKDESNYGQQDLWFGYFKPAVTSVFWWWSNPYSGGINQILAKGRNFRFVLFYLPLSGIFPPCLFYLGLLFSPREHTALHSSYGYYGRQVSNQPNMDFLDWEQSFLKKHHKNSR